jgi:hypothetical protein
MSKGGIALLSLFKIDRSTQKLTTGRIHYFDIRHSLFDIRPARNALKPVCGKVNHLIYRSMITPTQRTLHGRRVFAFSEFLFRLDRPFFVDGWADLYLFIEITSCLRRIYISKYFRYFVTIEYFRLTIEYLRYSFDFKKDGAKRHQQIFNFQSSIFNSGLSGLGISVAAGLKNGQFNRKRNSEKANNEYRTRNNESSSGGQVSK